MSTVTVLIVIALLITVGVLVLGLLTMEQGGELEERYGARLMYARVGAQALVVVLLLLAVLIDQT